MRKLSLSIAGNLLAVVALSSAAAIAADKPFTGVFQGSGRQCQGRLTVRAKTIEWHTPFANCNQTSYELIEQDFSNTEAPRIAYLLKGARPCGFGVITLDVNPKYPDYWNASGYRSLEDYKKQSEDVLRCDLEKKDK